MIASGTISLGVLVGILVGYFVNEAKKMDQTILKSAISILAGGSVVAMFSLLGGLKEPPMRSGSIRVASSQVIL